MSAVAQWLQGWKFSGTLLVIWMVVVKAFDWHLRSGGQQRYVVLDSHRCGTSVGWATTMCKENSKLDTLATRFLSQIGMLGTDLDTLVFWSENDIEYTWLLKLQLLLLPARWLNHHSRCGQALLLLVFSAGMVPRLIRASHGDIRQTNVPYDWSRQILRAWMARTEVSRTKKECLY